MNNKTIRDAMSKDAALRAAQDENAEREYEIRINNKLCAMIEYNDFILRFRAMIKESAPLSLDEKLSVVRAVVLAVNCSGASADDAEMSAQWLRLLGIDDNSNTAPVDRLAAF